MLSFDNIKIILNTSSLCCFYLAGSHDGIVSEWKEPFNLQKGWLLWAVLGIVVAFLAIALTGAALALFNGETPEREVRDSSYHNRNLLRNFSVFKL